MKQIDELEAFNDGLGAGIHLATKYAWTKWDAEIGAVPDEYQECVGLWMHKTKRSDAGCHAQCFVRIPDGDGDGGHCLDGLNATELRSYVNPDFWIPMPKPGDL